MTRTRLLLVVTCVLLARVTTAHSQEPAAVRAADAALRSVPSAELERLEDAALDHWSARRFDHAIAHWHRLIALEPVVRRYRIGLVRTLVSAGDITGARQQLELARSVAATTPSDEANILIAEGEILRAEQRDDAATETFAAAANIAGRSRDTRPTAGSARRDSQLPWRLNTGALVDSFDNERDVENQLVVELGYRYSRDLLAYALYERHDRFDAIDDVYLLGLSVRPFDALGVRLNFGGSPDATFRPRTEGSVKLEWLSWERVQPALAYQVLDYPAGEVTTLTPGVRFFVDPFVNVELQYALTREIDGSDTRIGGLRVGWRAGQRWLPSVSFYRGSEALPPQIRADFQRAGAGVTWLASREWHLRGDYAYEDREGSYVGHSLALGVGLNF